MQTFPIDPQSLQNLFSLDPTKRGECLSYLNEHNGSIGLCETLHTSPTHGISTNEPSIAEREAYFGDNKPIPYTPKTLLSIIWGNLADPVLQILIGAAIISLVVGLLQDPTEGWFEGAAILIAVIIVITVATVNDYMRDKQFVRLNIESDTHRVVVVRDGVHHEISAHDLVVGDLISVNPGEIMSVDAVLVRSSGLKVDESAITGETRLIKKDALRAGDTEVNPFLISGSIANDGSGWAIVCSVGTNSIMGKNRMITGHIDADQETPLSERLTVIAEALGKLGLFAGILLAVVLLIYTGAESIAHEEWGDDEWAGVINAFILGITILVVAIPEGLPLALALSMAYSVLRMKREKIFVRHLKACEVMGAATNILSDKTGTLTQNRMTVTKSVLFGKELGTGQAYLSEQEKKLVGELIARNSTAFLSESNNKVELIGNKTECAMLVMTQQWGLPYDMFRDEQRVTKQFPFSSNAKRMTTVFDLDSDGVAVYCKGAGEVVLDLCSTTMSSQGRAPLTDDIKAEYKRQFQELAEDCLRIIGLAYKVCNAHELGSMSQEDIETDLVFVGFVGIEDPLRPASRSSVLKCKQAGVIVRMLTGDSRETAVKIAAACGILPEDLLPSELNDYVMEGNEMREHLGNPDLMGADGKIAELDEATLDRFKEMIAKLVVIARCSPEDKLLLVIGLMQLGEVVGVTGDGSNDASALKHSDVGLAMMSGTPYAKESSDIILLDDNFESVLNSVKWGRNVYSSIRKFLQFQITVNVVALFVSIVGALSVQVSPLTAVQMLWVNLIMDSMAALALATEPPTTDLLKGTPFGRTESIITTDMYITIGTQSAYQILALLLILYLGPSIFGFDAGWEDGEWTEDNGVHFTLFFQTFVVLQLFNEITCRKLWMSEWNFFANFFNNWIFIGILVVTLLVQISLVEFGGEPLKLSGLTWDLHLVAAFIGVGSLLFSLLIRVCVTSLRTHRAKSEEEQGLLENAE